METLYYRFYLKQKKEIPQLNINNYTIIPDEKTPRNFVEENESDLLYTPRTDTPRTDTQRTDTQNDDDMKSRTLTNTLDNTQREKELKRIQRIKEMQQLVSQQKSRYDENPNEAPKHTEKKYKDLKEKMEKEDDEWYGEFMGPKKTPEEIAEEKRQQELQENAEKKRSTFERQGASRNLH
jgi:hypothetical protein